MQRFCAHYYCAVVMFNPGRLHFSSLTQDTYTSCFLGVPQTSVDNNNFSDGKSLFLLFFPFFFVFMSECYKYQWTACALKCEAYLEASLHLVLLGGTSAYRNLFCLSLLWLFFFAYIIFLLGIGKTLIGLANTAFARVHGSELPSPLACSAIGNFYALCRIFTSVV